MIDDRFYADNFVTSEADPVKLAKLYSLAREHLQEGGFVIQSCISNDEALRTRMKEDGTLSAHDEEWEKVLGYRYNPLSEEMHVGHVKCDPNASTKWGVLSEAAKIFDPLYLCLPVTVRSRILIRSVWKNCLCWNDPLPTAVLNLIPSGDGVVRSARVRKGDGLGDVHSLKHLYPLELSLTANRPAELPTSGPVSLPGSASIAERDEDPSCSAAIDEERVWLCPVLQKLLLSLSPSPSLSLSLFQIITSSHSRHSSSQNTHQQYHCNRLYFYSSQHSSLSTSTTPTRARYTHLSIYLSFFLSIYLSIYLFIYLILFIYLSIYLSIDLSHSVYLSIYLSIYVCTYLSISLSLSIYIYIYYSVHLSIYLILFIHLSIYLSYSVHLSIYLSIYLILFIYLSVYLYLYLSLYLSIYTIKKHLY
ncbi:unnamed protein product [Acanthosepion pharaonis]|uniref:Uncharacterized protein n=1 Tax=Acanthosepion pharaonis TaxID=158019 RepID=A0A812AUY8_ACAPH|nr:unnamed protein product [Sepia pharaonis]